MKIIASHKIVSSRIAKNLVKYGFAQDYKTVYSAMIQMIKESDDIRLQELKELSAELAGNSTPKRREKHARELLQTLGFKTPKSVKVDSPKVAKKSKATKKTAGNVVELKSKRAQALAKLQEQDQIADLVKKLLAVAK